jgi:hypothetical protein
MLLASAMPALEVFLHLHGFATPRKCVHMGRLGEIVR